LELVKLVGPDGRARRVQQAAALRDLQPGSCDRQQRVALFARRQQLACEEFAGLVGRRVPWAELVWVALERRR
jgi:hypothetical protein